MGFGHTRFSSPDRTFQLIYIARDLPTAIAETIVRDRFEGAVERVLDQSEVEEWAVAEVTATAPLVALDLRTTGLRKLGVSTDAARAKEHREGQRLSAAIYDSFAIDGLLYASRLTSAECIAIYDRAVDVNLVATPAINLVCHLILCPPCTRLACPFAELSEWLGMMCCSQTRQQQAVDLHVESIPFAISR